MQSMQVAILDGNDLSRFGLQGIVERMGSGIASVEIFATLEGLEKRLHEKHFDILLLDDLLPRMLDIGYVLNTLHTQQSDMKIVLLSHSLNVNYVQRVLEHNVSGFIYKEERLADILPAALHLVRCEQLYVSPQATVLSYKRMRSRPDAPLNLHDQNVLELMYKGKTVQEIARLLNSKDKAVYYSQEKLRQVLEVPTTELIVAAAIKRGFIVEQEVS